MADVSIPLNNGTNGILSYSTEVPECGGGYWLQISSLNVTDSQQTCPGGWTLVNSPGRSCSSPSCSSSVFFNVPNVSYSQVCGRAAGYAKSSPDGFYRFSSQNIDTPYLDGVSITHGQPRQHIWSLAAGHGGSFRCPCDNTNRNTAPLPPSYVGNNYYCDGEYNGVLWDGKDCTTSCCTFNSPPWFRSRLTSKTMNNIEVRICADQPQEDEQVFLSTLFLYIK